MIDCLQPASTNAGEKTSLLIGWPRYRLANKKEAQTPRQLYARAHFKKSHLFLSRFLRSYFMASEVPP